MSLNPLQPLTFGMRHLMDIDVALGRPSTSWNARNEYRTSYTPTQRMGAGLGTIAAAALPAAALTAWFKRGAPVAGAELPAGTAKMRQIMSKGPVAAFTGVAAAVGTYKAFQMAQDDGNYSKLGTALGIEAGFLASTRIAHLSPVKTAGAVIVGGIVGNIVGKQVHVGLDAKGHIGEPIKSEAKRHEDGPLAVQDFGRGLWNSLVDTGPFSQGVNFGYTWKSREKFANEYSNSEQTGAMVGDLVAAGMLAGGALGTAKALTAAKGGATAEAAFAASRTAKIFLQPLQALQHVKGAKTGMYIAAGLGLAGVSAATMMRKDGASDKTHMIEVGATLAATAGTALLLKNSALIKHLNPGVQAAAATMTAAVLISALSSARIPVQQFLSDAGAVSRVKKSTSLNMGVSAGVGAAAGLAIGVKAASSFNLGGWKRMAAVGAGLGVGALMGSRFAPLMPKDETKVAIGAGAGALAGLGATRLLAHRSLLGTVGAIVVGAGVGVIGSALVAGSNKPAAAAAAKPAAAPDAPAKPATPEAPQIKSKPDWAELLNPASGTMLAGGPVPAGVDPADLAAV